MNRPRDTPSSPLAADLLLNHCMILYLSIALSQALPDHQSRDCCRGFGERAVGITDSDLNEWSDGAEWGLWLVSTKWGRSPGHFFWKMALIPSDCE